MSTPNDIRTSCRAGTFAAASTAGVCPGFSQANVIILPEKFASDFRLLCARNPVPCPLLGETHPGDPCVPVSLAKDSDIRTDCPLYNVYHDGVLYETKTDIMNEWGKDSVAFFIGCSYSFEAALVLAGLIPRHIELKTNVPMYRTKYVLLPAGVFKGHMVVSMRPYRPEDLERVRDITRPFIRTHGEPVAWGEAGAKALGITDVEGKTPDFGDPTVMRKGEIPVYFGCGVSPQLSVMDSAIPGVVIGHTPGQMLVLDVRDEDVCEVL